MRLLIARHGATANNAQARYTGQSDISLAPLGERQAEALGQALAHERLDAIITSDLRRALQTAAAVTRYHNVPLHQDADLREIAMGAWEGHTYAELLERDPEALAQWQADPLTYAPPQGETVAAFRDRLEQALDRWFTAYPDGTVFWVTHGGAIGVLLCQLLGMDINRRWQFRRDNAAITELDIGRAEHSVHSHVTSNTSETTSASVALYTIVMRLNDTAHLRSIEDGDGSAVEKRQVL